MRYRLKAWSRRVYAPGCMPSDDRLRAMARRGDIPGAFQDRSNNWWVETENNKASSVQHRVDVIIDGDPELQALVG